MRCIFMGFNKAQMSTQCQGNIQATSINDITCMSSQHQLLNVSCHISFIDGPLFQNNWSLWCKWGSEKWLTTHIGTLVVITSASDIDFVSQTFEAFCWGHRELLQHLWANITKHLVPVVCHGAPYLKGKYTNNNVMIMVHATQYILQSHDMPVVVYLWNMILMSLL